MTQANNSVFSISIFGFSEAERRVLARVFALSATRNPTFALADSASAQSADVIMIDADDPESVAAWQASEDSGQGQSNAPVIMASRQPPADTSHSHVRKPFIATRLLVALEAIVTKELGFSPVLAIDPDDRLSDTALARHPAPSEDVRSRCKALVVDDSLPVRVQMDIALRPFASHVDFAETGEKAFELVGQNNYDIVFLDVVLPGADGYEICRAIKSDKENKKTPVIMLTSNSSPADRIKGELAGCDTYLIKPVRHEVFREVLERYLNLLSGAAPEAVTGGHVNQGG